MQYYREYALYAYCDIKLPFTFCITETCLFGDAPGIIQHLHYTCSDYLSLSGAACYGYDYARQFCCGSCIELRVENAHIESKFLFEMVYFDALYIRLYQIKMDFDKRYNQTFILLFVRL